MAKVKEIQKEVPEEINMTFDQFVTGLCEYVSKDLRKRFDDAVTEDCPGIIYEAKELGLDALAAEFLEELKADPDGKRVLQDDGYIEPEPEDDSMWAWDEPGERFPVSHTIQSPTNYLKLI